MNFRTLSRAQLYDELRITISRAKAIADELKTRDGLNTLTLGTMVEAGLIPAPLDDDGQDGGLSG